MWCVAGVCVCVCVVLPVCVPDFTDLCRAHLLCVCAERHDKGYSAVDGCGAAGLDPQLASVDKEIDRITDSFIKISVEDETESDDASQGRVSSESEVFVAMATVPGVCSV